MMGGLCFMVSGRMCCSVSGKGGLLIRLGPAATEALREPNVKPMKMGKRVMRGFVRVSPEGYQTDSQLDRWIQRGIECALAATPKRARTRR